MFYPHYAKDKSKKYIKSVEQYAIILITPVMEIVFGKLLRNVGWEFLLSATFGGKSAR